jgi:acylglycerol lipase
MNHQDGFFTGVRGAKIYHQHWLPETAPKAAVVIVHGLAEHSGRYTNLVNHLVPLGYAVYALDHLGHGKSEGARVYVKRFSDYTETLDTFVDQVRAQLPDTPSALFGHSMGGLIAARYLIDHQDKLSVGAILSAPAVKPGDGVSPVTIALGKVLSALAPKAGVLALDAEAISRDPAVVEAYVNDPLVTRGKTTARLAAEMLKAMQAVADAAHTITLPLLILQGQEDCLVDPEGAQMLSDRVGSADKRVRFYPELYHEVCNEPEREEVLADIANWLDAHLP